MAQWFRNKVVVVANLTTGSSDMGATPFERDFPFGEVHLHVLNMILSGQFLRDASLTQTLLSFALPLALLTLVALGGGPGLILPVFFAVLGGFLFALQWTFSGGVILPAIGPVVAMTGCALLLLAARYLTVDRERRFFQSALGPVCRSGRFLPSRDAPPALRRS